MNGPKYLNFKLPEVLVSPRPMVPIHTYFSEKLKKQEMKGTGPPSLPCDT